MEQERAAKRLEKERAAKEAEMRDPELQAIELIRRSLRYIGVTQHVPCVLALFPGIRSDPISVKRRMCACVFLSSTLFRLSCAVLLASCSVMPGLGPLTRPIDPDSYNPTQ